MKHEEAFEVEELDVEACVKNDLPIKRARRYLIRVDKQRVASNSGHLTGAEILALVGKTPETHKLFQHKRGHQPTLVSPTEIVDLTKHGIERFTTMPKDTTEGLETGAQTARRQFQLPEGDALYLNGLGLPWEAVKDGNVLWLMIHGWRTPTGYNQPSVSLALLVPPSYPDAQLDMVYFKPALNRTDGKTIGGLADQAIGPDVWQRWSRHRTATNAWRPSEDDIASHLGLVDEWLRREFEKR